MAEVKNMKIYNVPGTPHYGLMFEGGGVMPEELKGMYTSELQAKKAFDTYMTKKNRPDATVFSKQRV